MVILSRIYTKTGDDGSTGLGDGTRVAKDHARVEAYGTVDEANAFLGLVRIALGTDHPHQDLLQVIQNDLFDVGADLCVPLSVDSPESGLRIQKGQVDRLEKAIDDNNANLKALASFVLPGGTTASAHAHVARTVVRRAERQVVALGRMESLNPQLLIYLNRLSDLLFVLSRAYNNNGTLDVLWVPGVSRAGAVS